MAKQEFVGCWYCDNLVDHPDQIGLLHLGFPRCMVLVPSMSDLIFSTFEKFRNGVSAINWLDPSDCGTPKDQEEVLRLLWNFSIAQEQAEDELAESGGYF